MIEFFVSMIVSALFLIGAYAVPWWVARHRNKQLMGRLLLLSEKGESLAPTTLSSKDGRLVTVFNSEVVELLFHTVSRDNKTNVLYFEMIFRQLSFPTWMTVTLNQNTSRWQVGAHEISMSQMHTMAYPGFHELNHDLNIGVAGYYELSIKAGRVTLSARFSDESVERIATRIKQVLINASKQLKVIKAQLPDEPWLLFLALCQNNPETHPVQLDALSFLMAQEAQMPQVRELIERAFDQWPESMLVALLERSEAQFNRQQVIEPLYFRLDTVKWTTRRWLNMAMEAQQARVTEVLYQKIMQNCAQNLGVEGLATLDRQDKAIVVPLLITMTKMDDSPETHQRLATLVSPMLRWLDFEDATQWMIQLSQNRSDLCDVKDFATVVHRPRAQAHHPALARTLAFVLSQHPQKMQQMAWCDLVVTLFVHFGEDWAQHVFELILNHASPAIFGRLQRQINQTPNGKSSPLGRIFAQNKVLLEDTLRARQGGLTLAEGDGPSGGLTLASPGGKLTVND